MQPNFTSSRILLPARPWFVLSTLFIALLLNFLPTAPWLWMPDFVALVLCFWSVREPRLIGMGWAFMLGICMDVGNSAALGQHPLAYVLVAYGASTFSRRILWFPLLQQAFQVFPLLLMSRIVQALIRSAAGASYPEWLYYVAPFLAAALWIPATYLLLLPQFRPVEQDPNRPI